MATEKKKDFYNVADLTKLFNAFRESMRNEVPPEIDRRTKIHFNLITWQIEAQLAIAQQLAVISGHLAQITAEAERQGSGL